MSLRRIATSAATWGLIQKWGYHAIRLMVFVVLARLLRYARALTPAMSGTAVMAGMLLLLQFWMPAVTGAQPILVVSVLVGTASYTAAVCAAAPEQRRALWRLLAQRMPAHGARS